VLLEHLCDFVQYSTTVKEAFSQTVACQASQ